MNSVSILFNNPTDRANAQHADVPLFFVDLNLDQIVDAIAAGWDEYDLKPFFYFKLNSIDAVRYRHEVFQDLENQTLYEHVKVFTEQMREVRRHLKLVKKLYHQRQKETWFLYAMESYCAAVKHLAAAFSSSSIDSRGFTTLQEFLTTYVNGSDFTSMEEQISKLKTNLANVKYQIIIRGNSFTVQDYEPGMDYSKKIEEIFEKFKWVNAKDYKAKYKSGPEYMNRVEAQILDFVARLNDGLFSELEEFFARYAPAGTGIDETVATFDREIHFYISYLEHISQLKNNKLKFCYPRVVNTSKKIYNYEGFDLTLAQKLSEENAPIVCNNFYLKGQERVIVVSGPNQGGKTTFARTFAQLHYLGALGCPVPGSRAQLFFFDQMFTQFERSEKVENQRGKLEDDLTRIYSIFEHATTESIIIMNEIFDSTTLEDAKFLNTKIMEKILNLDLLCIWVTFVDELASFSEQTVSMTSTIVPEDPALRTFKIVRRPADGFAYALAIAEKHNLTYQRIKERIQS